jgi:hypothetical protein
MRKLVYKSGGTWKKRIFFMKLVKGFSIFFLFTFLLFSFKAFAQQASLNNLQDSHRSKKIALNWSTGNSYESSSRLISDEISVNNLNTAGNVKVTLEQVRNGSAASPVDPGAWASGNLNGSQAHYAEKWSIPYRLTITGLTDGSHVAVIEWDFRQGGKFALDYITHYNSIDNGPGSHLNTFGHTKEAIDPRIGVSGVSGSASTTTIPAVPQDDVANSFNALPNDSLRKMSIWNGTITSIVYGPVASLVDAASAQQATITFTSTASTVVLSWGGHIASEQDWGVGNSASAISGSPYHTRLISFDGSGGNQDRSLSADAVIDPPTCTLDGASPVECNTQNTYTNSLTVPSGYTFAWSLPSASNTSGATFNGSTSNSGSVSVNSGSAKPAGGGACGTTYTVRFSVLKNGTEVSHCDKVVAVQDTGAPTVTASGTTTSISGCNPSTATIDAALGSATATDACSTPTVTSSDGSVTGTCTKSQTRTFTATDACGNTATTSRTVTWTADNTAPTLTATGGTLALGCNPTSAALDGALGSASATDACGTPTVTSTTGSVQGTGCSKSQTRTFTATDACGNTISTSRTATWTADLTAPTITATGSSTALGCNPTTAQIEAALGSATATDGCSTPTVTPSTGTVQGSGCAKSQTRTFTATDGCGNTATTSRTATWTADVTPPTLTCPGDVHLQCMSDNTDPGGALGSASATDACGTPTIGHSDVVSGTACNRKLITRTWTATDACGNTASCVQHIFVADDIAPTITCSGSATPTVTDNCSSTANITLFHSGDTWTAIDEAGNISTLTCAGSGTIARIANSSTSESVESQTTVKAYPNPFSDKVKFLVTSAAAGRGSLEVYNMMGQKVKTVYQGFITKGSQTFELSLPNQQVANLIYVLRVGDKKMSGKLLQINQ